MTRLERMIDLLDEHEDGLTVSEIATMMDIRRQNADSIVAVAKAYGFIVESHKEPTAGRPATVWVLG